MRIWRKWRNPTIKPPFGSRIDWSDPITQGLVGCWLFNEYSNRPVDLVSCFVSSPKKTIDYVDGGIFFDGSQLIVIGNGDLTPPDVRWTFVCNVRLFGTSSDLRIYSESSTVNSNPLMTIEPYNNCLDTYVRDDSGSAANHNQGNKVINDGKVHQIAVTDPDDMKLYVDGYLDEYQGNREREPRTTNITTIGGIRRSTDSYLLQDGIIYHVLIFHRVLSDSEIERLYYEPYSMFLAPFPVVMVDLGATVNYLTIDSIWNVFTAKEITLPWNVKTDLSITAAWKVYNQKDNTITWNVLTEDGITLKFHIFTQDSRDINWRVFTEKDTTIVYRIFKEDSNEIVYKIFTSDEKNINWNILAEHFTDLSWNVLTIKENNIVYQILTEHITELDWKIFTQKDYKLIWNVLTEGTLSTTLVWKIFTQKDEDLNWNVKDALSTELLYKILTALENDIIYNVKTEKQTEIVWLVKEQKATELLWNVLSASTNETVLAWNVLTQSEVVAAWHVKRSLETELDWKIFIVKDLDLIYHILDKNETVASWKIKTKEEKQLVWNVFSEIGLQPSITVKLEPIKLVIYYRSRSIFIEEE